IDIFSGGVDHAEEIEEFLILHVLQFDLCLFLLHEIAIEHGSKDGRMLSEVLLPSTTNPLIYTKKCNKSPQLTLSGSISLSHSVKAPPTVFFDCTKFRGNTCTSDRL
ncbi:hypothetical protein PFISCL1PPCAC_21239, partial [Pristionchus fissidentatus]